MGRTVRSIEQKYIYFSNKPVDQSVKLQQKKNIKNF